MNCFKFGGECNGNSTCPLYPCDTLLAYEKGRADERKEIIEILARLVVCEVINVETYETIRNQIGAEE